MTEVIDWEANVAAATKIDQNDFQTIKNRLVSDRSSCGQSTHMSFKKISGDRWKVVIFVEAHVWYPDVNEDTNPELVALGYPEWVYTDFDPVPFETAQKLWNDTDIWSYCDVSDDDERAELRS